MNQLDLFEKDTDAKIRRFEKWMLRLQRELWRLRMTNELTQLVKKQRTLDVKQIDMFGN